MQLVTTVAHELSRAHDANAPAVLFKDWVVSNDTWMCWFDCGIEPLLTEAVKGLSLALERVDDVEGGDGLAARMLRVADGVADDVLEEILEHRAGLLVHEAGDALHATTASQAADRGLRNALDVVAEHLAVALAGTTLASLTATGHDEKRRLSETQLVSIAIPQETPHKDPTEMI